MSTSETVKSTGDSWVVCRSKSYLGRIYYFNTLSGEAVWNLSEPEIEKAKNSTKVLQNYPDFQIVNCPEPSHSPQDSGPQNKIPVHKLIQPKIYNKQVINNSFSKSHQKTQFLPYTQLTPIQFNIPITPFNTGVWNTPPQPIFVTPSNINPSSSSMNKHNYVPANTSISLSSRFKNLCQSDAISKSIPSRSFNKNYVWKNNINGFSNKIEYKNKQQAFQKIDLRTLLMSKRNNFKEVSEDYDLENFGEEINSIASKQVLEQNNQMVVHEEYHDIDNDYWSQENLQPQAKNIDTTPLKILLHVENCSSWYIVTDSNVFLNHIIFINNLMKSDCQCRLLIPQQVMNKIKIATNSRLRTQAHRAAYFISEKVDENVAVIDQEDTEENFLCKDAIISCSTKLIEEGKPVVILTDDIELHSTECSIPIYTVIEMKKVLSHSNISHTILPKGHEKIPLKLKRNIKITIENDATTDVLDQDTIHDHRLTRGTIAFESERQEIFEKLKSQSNDQDENKLNNLKTPEKTTDDIGVQADPKDLMVAQGSLDTNDSSNTIQNDKNTNLPQTKSIKLKRQSSFDIAKLNVAKKYFKQSKRKAKSSLSLISENSTDKQNQLEPFDLYPTESMESVLSSENNRLITRNKFDNSFISDTPSVNITKLTKRFEHVIQDTRQFEEYNKSHRSENVMFEVTSQAMEDYLKMKCDEWTSRFVQIMEEALTQVLQMDPPYVLDTMPPPWNIYEATECVKRKYNNVDDICDAATKLSYILFEFGASRGKIKTDISPQKYMEMYSYGVYLIDTLQGHLNNIEDLHTAEQSLAKLLRDIQDPHLDPSNHDLFIDTNAENQTICNEQDALNGSIQSTESACNNKNLNDLADSTPNTKLSNTSNASSNYRLRSHRKRLLENPENNGTQEITFIRNIDLKSSFFTNLNLKENSVIDNNNEIQDAITNEDANESGKENVNEVVNNNDALTNNEVLDQTEKVNTNNSIDNMVKEIELAENNGETEPKIIRNFTKCLEFEEKLKNIDVESDSVQDNWYIQSDSDYTGNEELDYEEEYFYDNDYEEYDDYDYNAEENESQLDNNADQKNDNFKLFMEKIKDEIKTTFLAIHSFCTTSHDTLSSSDNRESKLKIQVLGKQTLTHVNSLCDALTRILSRDESDCIYRLKELLKINSLDQSVIDNDNIAEYRTFINKCLEQGHLLRDSIKLVIDASEEQT